MPASDSKGAPSRTEVDEDKIAMVFKYLKYRLEDAKEVVLRSCDVKRHCETILNYTNGTLQVNPDSEAVACLECIKQQLHLVVTYIMDQSGRYYELDCNGVLKHVINKSFMMVSEELTATAGLLSCVVPPTTTAGSIFAEMLSATAGSTLAEGLSTTAGLLSCAEGLTTTAGSTLAVPPTTGVGSILYAVWAAYSAPIIIGLVVIGLLLLVIAVFARKRWNQNRRPEMEEM